MPVFVEFHVLQNIAPSLLNRDDTGAHKDALFGGVRRARISSQCLKRAMREHWKRGGQIAPAEQALRTKRIRDALADRLAARGRDRERAFEKIPTALAGLNLGMADAQKSQYLLFLGADEIEAMADAIDTYWDAIEEAPSSTDTTDESKSDTKSGAKNKKKAKSEAKDACPPELVKAMKEAIADTRSMEVQLFGRMLADLPNANIEACCQVAHALGTAALEREFDYYTAVDDLKPDDNAGADMIGQVEFASSCFYRYAVVDLGTLHDRLGRNRGATERSLRLFAEAMIHALPSGKQNSFAAHQLPCHVAMTLRTGSLPRAMTNAFERPVRATARHSLSAEASQALEKFRANLDRSYGATGKHWFHDLSGAELPGGETDVAAVIEAAVPAAMSALES